MPEAHNPQTPSPSQPLGLSDPLFRMVLDHMGDLVAVVDLQGRRLYNSPSYANLFGDLSRVSGSDSFAEIHPDDRKRIREVFEQTVTTGVGRRAEYRFLLSDKRVRHIESQSDVIRGPDGKPSRIVIVARDITERKLAEQQLIQSEKMASLGRMAAGLAHELRNPLAVILQGLALIHNTKSAEERDEASALIEKSAERANEIIQRVMRFSRPAPLNLAPRKLEPLVKAALDLVKQEVMHAMTSVKVQTDFPQDLPEVILDENALLQVLINLCVNAVQAMPAGGTLKLRAYAADMHGPGGGVGKRSEDAFREGGRAVVCEISDTGSGIPEDILGKIFDPFFTTKPVGQGTGLGLPIVRTIIQGHKGLIRVESQVGSGTTFRLFLHPAS